MSSLNAPLSLSLAISLALSLSPSLVAVGFVRAHGFGNDLLPPIAALLGFFSFLFFSVFFFFGDPFSLGPYPLFFFFFFFFPGGCGGRGVDLDKEPEVIKVSFFLLIFPSTIDIQWLLDIYPLGIMREKKFNLKKLEPYVTYLHLISF
jgi:hypothetical protein